MAEPIHWILASASPRRQQLLAELGIAFDVVTADVDEWEASDADPEALVSHNARLKAEKISNAHPRSRVIGSDTTVALEGHVLNKPADLNEARSMLGRLSGRTHEVFTAVCILQKQPAYAVSFVERSQVTFNDLDEGLIERYFKLVNPLDKAGAYGIQEHRKIIIAGWEGSLSNVMGLPIERLAAKLSLPLSILP
ncbi:MAG: septum formation protein Maf [Opitutales bacterium]|nr:septum formation protein Maf [Opitutales bacterium]